MALTEWTKTEYRGWGRLLFGFGWWLKRKRGLLVCAKCREDLDGFYVEVGIDEGNAYLCYEHAVEMAEGEQDILKGIEAARTEWAAEKV